MSLLHWVITVSLFLLALVSRYVTSGGVSFSQPLGLRLNGFVIILFNFWRFVSFSFFFGSFESESVASMPFLLAWNSKSEASKDESQLNDTCGLLHPEEREDVLSNDMSLIDRDEVLSNDMSLISRDSWSNESTSLDPILPFMPFRSRILRRQFFLAALLSFTGSGLNEHLFGVSWGTSITGILNSGSFGGLASVDWVVIVKVGFVSL